MRDSGRHLQLGALGPPPRVVRGGDRRRDGRVGRRRRPARRRALHPCARACAQTRRRASLLSRAHRRGSAGMERLSSPRKGGFLEAVHLYRKVPRDLTDATVTGGVLSMGCALVMFYLFVSNVAEYMRMTTSNSLPLHFELTWSSSRPRPHLDLTSASPRPHLDLTSTSLFSAARTKSVNRPSPNYQRPGIPFKSTKT